MKDSLEGKVCFEGVREGSSLGGGNLNSCEITEKDLLWSDQRKIILWFFFGMSFKEISDNRGYLFK